MTQPSAISIRPFVGARDFDDSRSFYRALGFEEIVISKDMVVFRTGTGLSFYLQKYYVRDWVDNTMLFLEVEDVDAWRAHVATAGVVNRYKNVKLSEIVQQEWGREFFLHDPSGVLWHIGSFAA